MDLDLVKILCLTHHFPAKMSKGLYEQNSQNEYFRDYEKLYNNPTEENFRSYVQKYGEERMQIMHLWYGLYSVEYMKKHKKISFKSECVKAGDDV